MTSNYRKTTSNTYRAADFITKTTADGLYLNVADNEVINGTLQLNNTVSNPCFTASTAGVLTLNTIPITNTDLTSSITNNNNLTTKKYVDNAITNSSSNSFSTLNLNEFYLCQYSITYNNGLIAPYLGTSTTANSTTNYLSILYCNFNTNNSTLTSNSCILEFNYQYCSNMTVPGSTYNSANKNSITASSPTYTQSSIQLGASMPFSTSCMFQITINTNSTYPTLVVQAIQQTTSIWNNPTISTSTTASTGLVVGSAKAVAHTYNALVYNFYPITFAYTNANKFKITIGVPDCENQPARNGWWSNMSASVKVKTASPSYINAVSSTTNTLSNLNGGIIGGVNNTGCYISLT